MLRVPLLVGFGGVFCVLRGGSLFLGPLGKGCSVWVTSVKSPAVQMAYGIHLECKWHMQHANMRCHWGRALSAPGCKSSLSLTTSPPFGKIYSILLKTKNLLSSKSLSLSFSLPLHIWFSWHSEKYRFVVVSRWWYVLSTNAFFFCLSFSIFI